MTARRGGLKSLSGPLLAAVLQLGASAAAPPAPAQPGEGLTPRVVCSSNPGQSYALYLPSSRDRSRPAPVLFLLDALGRAMIPLDRFREGADRYGIILASSYNSASDEPADPNLQAVGAMWKDVAARLSLDPARIYLGGLSGTARAACDIAWAAHGKIAGVIAAGAGFASGHPPDTSVPFLFFGTVGEEDFNYYEMIDLETLLGKLGLPHRIEEFAGRHEWMPSDLATQAIEWLQIRSAASDPAAHAAFLEAAWRRGLDHARRLEAEGRILEAMRGLRSLAADFGGFRDVRDATAARLRLEASKEAQKKQQEWEERRERETRTLEEAWRLLGAAVRTASEPARPARLLADLRVSEWKRKAAGGDEEAVAARRVLAAILVQTGEYLPREEESRGDFRAVALLLTVAAAIRPEDPGIAYRLAVAQARSGDRREALRALERCLQAGFLDPERLRREPAFDSIRDLPRYRKIEEEMSRRRGEPASGMPPTNGGESERF
jgi:predicted esterase